MKVLHWTIWLALASCGEKTLWALEPKDVEGATASVVVVHSELPSLDGGISFSAEKALVEPGPLGERGNVGSSLATASAGDVALVAWMDCRFRRPFPSVSTGKGCAFMAGRFDAEGQLLDPTGLLLSGLNREVRGVSAVFNGNDFVVAWSEKKDNSTETLLGVRVTKDGVLRDPQPRVLVPSLRSNSPFQPNDGVALAQDRSHTLLAWTDGQDGHRRAYGLILNSDLTPAAAAPTLLGGESMQDLVAAGGREGFLVAWTEPDPQASSVWGSDIAAVRVSASGVPQGSVFFVTTTDSAYEPSVAFDGTGYLVVWASEVPAQGPDIRAARVSKDGVVLDTAPLILDPSPLRQERPSVTFAGDRYNVVWQSNAWDAQQRLRSSLRTATVKPDGAVTPFQTLTLLAAGESLDFDLQTQSVQSQVFVAWNSIGGVAAPFLPAEGRFTLGRVQKGSATASFDRQIEPAKHAPTQTRPLLAENGAQTLIAWVEGTYTGTYAGSESVWVARVKGHGEVQGGGPLALHPPAPDTRLYGAAATEDGWLVAYSLRNALVVHHVALDGTVAPPQTVATSPNPFYDAALTCRGPQCALVYVGLEYFFKSPVVSTISVLSLDSAGRPAGGALQVAQVNLVSGVALASHNDGLLVVWSDNRQGADEENLYASRIRGGVVLDPGGFSVTAAAGAQRHPSVVQHADGYLVAWLSLTDRTGVYLAQVSSAGVVSAEHALDSALPQPIAPALSSDGSQAWALWAVREGAKSRLSWASLDSAGEKQESVNLVENEREDLYEASATPCGLIAYSRVVESKGAGTSRIFVRSVESGQSCMR